MRKKVIQPVAPTGMEIVLNYVCPECEQSIPTIAPTTPVELRCPLCNTKYPIIPADPMTLQYLSLMYANGAALVNADFL